MNYKPRGMSHSRRNGKLMIGDIVRTPDNIIAMLVGRFQSGVYRVTDFTGYQKYFESAELKLEAPGIGAHRKWKHKVRRFNEYLKSRTK